MLNFFSRLKSTPSYYSRQVGLVFSCRGGGGNQGMVCEVVFHFQVNHLKVVSAVRVGWDREKNRHMPTTPELPGTRMVVFGFECKAKSPRRWCACTSNPRQAAAASRKGSGSSRPKSTLRYSGRGGRDSMWGVRLVYLWNQFSQLPYITGTTSSNRNPEAAEAQHWSKLAARAARASSGSRKPWSSPWWCFPRHQSPQLGRRARW